MRQRSHSVEGSSPYRFEYLLHLPPEAGAPQPLIVFLHGSGERGSDLSLVTRYGLPARLETDPAFPFIVASPQLPHGRVWALETPSVLGLLDHLLDTLPVDPERVYITGFSLGGTGVWALIQAAPERFAAGAVVAGRALLAFPEALRGVPMWIAHGEQDTVVPPENAAVMAEQLRRLETPMQLRLFPGGHSAQVFFEDALYAWLLEHRRTRKTGQ